MTQVKYNHPEVIRSLRLMSVALHKRDTQGAKSHWNDYKRLIADREETLSGRRNAPDNSPAASWESGISDKTCPKCNRTFSTSQGLGLHFHHGCPADTTKEGEA